MNLKYVSIPLFLAVKSIRRSNIASLIMTPLIIGVSFINLTFTSSLFSGVTKTLDNQLINNLYANIILRPQQDKKYLDKADQIKEVINSIPGIIGTASHYKLSGSVTYDKNKDGRNVENGIYPILGISPLEEIKVTDISKHVIEGSYLSPQDTDQILLGVEISGGHGAKSKESSLKDVKINDEVSVIYSNGITRKYRVKGIFRTGFDIIDKTGYITKKEAESIFGIYNEASEIIVKTAQKGDEKIYINKLKNIGYDKIRIDPWDEFDEISKTLRKSFDVLNWVIIIVTLIVTGAAIFIVIYINIINKKKQIGILKAIGVSENYIIASYLFQTLFYVILGIPIGLAMLYFIFVPYFEVHPLDMAFGLVSLDVLPKDLINSVINITVVSLLSGFIPAWRTSEEPILKSIWGV